MSDDLDRIMAVMETAFDPAWGEAWNRVQVAELLVLASTHYTLTGPRGAPPAEGEPTAGFTLIRAAPGEEELLLVGVDPAHRGRGLGTLLLERFAADARARGAERIFLEMRSNNPVQSLYLAQGFEPIGRRREYYRRPNGDWIDAITFAKSL